MDRPFQPAAPSPLVYRADWDVIYFAYGSAGRKIQLMRRRERKYPKAGQIVALYLVVTEAWEPFDICYRVRVTSVAYSLCDLATGQEAIECQVEPLGEEDKSAHQRVLEALHT